MTWGLTGQSIATLLLRKTTVRIITPDNSAFPPSGPGPAIEASFEITINVTGNSSAGFSTFFTTTQNQSSLGAGMYDIVCLAEVTNTTIPGASAVLQFFTIQYEAGGSPLTTGIGVSDLSVNQVYSGITIPPVVIDIPSAVQWRYAVTGWTSGACTLKLRVQLTRLC